MVTELVGIDLGGTKIFGAQVQLDDDGPTVGADTKRATPTTDAGAIVDAVVEVVRDLDAAPAAVGIGTPGVIEPGSGVVEYAPNLAGFDRPVALADAVADRLGAPGDAGHRQLRQLLQRQLQQLVLGHHGGCQQRQARGQKQGADQAAGLLIHSLHRLEQGRFDAPGPALRGPARKTAGHYCR